MELKVIKKISKMPCYCCNKSIRGVTAKRETCKACNGTGEYKDSTYYHIVKGKDGKKYCFSGDTLK